MIPRAAPIRRVPMSVFVVATIGAVLMAVHFGLGFEASRLESPTNGFGEVVGLALDWRTYVPVGVIVVLEWWLPADKTTEPRALRRAAATDVVWTLIHILLWAPLIVLTLRGMAAVFHGALSGVRIDLSATLPNGVLLAIGFLIAEFIRWAVHLACHKVPVLWRIHSVHHSQTALRWWTDFRVHPVEGFLREMCTAVPFFVIGGQYSSLVGAVGFAFVWVTPLHHANVRLGHGPLRYLFVTPQSHRVHHSTDPVHFDTNYGNVLSIFDRLFGTLADDHTSYPVTGLEGYSINREADMRPAAVIRTYADQLVRPFGGRVRASG